MVDDNCLNMKYRKRRLTMAEELTLEKFEEAYNIIKKVVLPTKLVESEYYSNLTGIKYFLNRKICSLPEHIKSVEHITRSVR